MLCKALRKSLGQGWDLGMVGCLCVHPCWCLFKPVQIVGVHSRKTHVVAARASIAGRTHGTGHAHLVRGLPNPVPSVIDKTKKKRKEKRESWCQDMSVDPRLSLGMENRCSCSNSTVHTHRWPWVGYWARPDFSKPSPCYVIQEL